MAYSDKLKNLVYENKRTVSVRDVVYKFNIHVSEARRILEDFQAVENKDKVKLNVVYVVSGGAKNSTEDFKCYKLAYAEINELEKIKNQFESIDSCSLFSVSSKDVEPIENSVQTPVLFDVNDIQKQQKLTYIINDAVELRTDRLTRFKMIAGLSDDTNDPVKVEAPVENVKKAKKEIPDQNKKSSKSRNNKKQSKLTGFDTKPPKKEKPVIETTPDPFSDEEEEQEEQVSEESEKMEVEPTPSPSPPSSPPPKVKSEPIEEPVAQAVKSKKRKRVRVFDSDEEDEEALALKILAAGEESNHIEEEKPSKKSKKSGKTSQPMETRQVSEEYMDEDGYTQVRLVKKLVPVENQPENKEKEEEEDNKNSNKSKKSKPAEKKVKVESDQEDEETKPKTKKLSKAAQAKKGQVSITNFFKPAAKV